MHRVSRELGSLAHWAKLKAAFASEANHILECWLRVATLAQLTPRQARSSKLCSPGPGQLSLRPKVLELRCHLLSPSNAQGDRGVVIPKSHLQ